MTKKNPLFFLFLLLLIPTMSLAAEMHTLQVAFSFSAPDSSTSQLLGYRLYKDGVQVCETNDPDASVVTCDFLTDYGTFNFALTAYYSDSTESPFSPLFPFTIDSSTIPPPTPVPPTAVLSSSTAAGNAPLNVTFDGRSSSSPNSPIESYSWTFGDGSQATGETVSHTFTVAGTYYTQLRVTNGQGLSDTVSTPIVVVGSAPANEKPIAVIAASETTQGSPLTFSFDGSQSSDPDGSITQYSWNFGDGTTGSGQSAQHTYSSAATYTVSLQVTDDRGDTATASTEIVCTTPLPDTINIEVGEVTIDHNWTTVAFENTFSHPVIVAGPPTTNDSDPVTVRIRNINETGFEIRLQEWDYQDGIHAQETFSYIVMEEGTYTLDNGSKIEAGNFTGRRGWHQIPLQQLYDYTPVILTQVVTDNETDAVTGRIRNINQYSFEFKLQEMQETIREHMPETISYIAWEPGKGEISGLFYEIGATAKRVNHKWFNLDFETEFPGQPFFIAGLQTCSGGDTATVRSQDLSQTATKIMVQEEQSKDNETKHVKEVVGYFTIGAIK